MIVALAGGEMRAESIEANGAGHVCVALVGGTVGGGAVGVGALTTYRVFWLNVPNSLANREPFTTTSYVPGRSPVVCTLVLARQSVSDVTVIGSFLVGPVMVIVTVLRGLNPLAAITTGVPAFTVEGVALAPV
jgi:hypothetical protein